MAKRGNRYLAQELNERYRVGANHARYRANGLWYHPLDEFPAAYFDANGYILFKTREDYETCEYLTIQQDVHVAGDGISSIPGYVRFVDIKSTSKLVSEARSSYTVPSRGKRKVSTKVSSRTSFDEGAVKEIVVELQKRDPKLRAKAVAEYGDTCCVCGFNFKERYGNLGSGYIEVHHLKPLSQSKSKRTTTITDVAVVCANCHRMLHRNGREPLSIEELRDILAKQKRKQ